jgi:preprotein translocase subunit SecG
MINIIIVVISLLLIGVVIIQNSKGGGLDSSFSSQQNLMGVKKSTEVVEKATWTLVGLLVVLCIISTKLNTGNTLTIDKSSATEAAKSTQTEQAAPAAEDFLEGLESTPE